LTGTMMLARNPVTVLSATKYYKDDAMADLVCVGCGPGDPEL